MGTLGWITIIGLVAVVILFVVFRKRRSLDVVEELVSKRRPTAKIANPADFVQGLERLPVALALTESVLFYENADLQANLELKRIDEVEYDDELAIGKAIANGRVLRLRSHGQTFEFILPPAEAQKWASLLPPHRLGEAGAGGVR
jgi:hypothetical protein